MNQTIGELLRARRRELGLTQVAAAPLLGVNQSTVSAWEKGTVPSDDQWATIAAFLGIDVEQVVLACYYTKASGVVTQDDGLRLIRELQAELAALRARLDRLESGGGQ